MPNVEIVIGAKNNTKKGVDESKKSFMSMKRDVGMAAGIAVGAFVAFNAVLDGTQKRLEEIGHTDTAKGIEDAQQAWTALADTLLSAFADTGAIDWLVNGLKTAAESARELYVLLAIGAEEVKKTLRMQDEATTLANEKAIIEKSQSAYTASIASNKKEELSASKDLTAELKAQNNLLMDADEAVRKMDARGLQKAQAGLAKSNVTVSFKGSPALVSLVQDVMIDGVRER